ncbi:MAG: adenosylcobalamin-dependent ribonucleoside-diphosphate reductase [Candidatus Woesearchaeota archaeon]
MKCNYEKIVDGKKRLVKIIVQSKALIEFLKYNKILKQNKRIFFPEAILQSRKEGLFSFLYAYFNTMERFFNINTFDNDEKNEEFLLMAQNVLDAIGINSKIKYNENNKVFIILNNKSIKDYIKSIEDYKNSIEQHTYDLCLEDEHLFFANGLYAHNSGRRGALIITLSIHHPEIMNFIQMKKDLNKVTGANISVKLTDEFLKAVQQDKEYEQRWPVDSDNPKISKKVKAKDIWDEIVDGAWSSAEPGVLFFDNIIKESPADCYSDFGYKTTSVNPCSELPLSERDSCRLLLLNLYGYVDNPFTKKATFNFDKFYKHSQIAQRFMDDIVDLETECVTNIIKKVKDDPEPMEVKRDELNLWQQVRKFCKEGRRTGTGVNAVGDMLAALGYQYGSEKSIKFLDKVFRTLKLGCYRSSVDMAKELGAFKIWDYNLEKNNPFLLRIKDEDAKLYKDMKQYGRRNIACLTMAPSGSVSILTQTTSGVEPLFQMSYKRRKKVTDEKDTKVDFIDETGDKWHEFEVIHPRIKQWKEITKKDDIKESPWYGCCANDIDWKSRVKLQGKINKNIDHSISSTLNLPKTATKKDVATIYKAAWEYDCKGITVYRDGCRSGVMINDEKKEEEKINKTDAPKRPEILPCEIFHTSVKKHKYFVLVGLLCGEPYEVFAGKNDDVVKKHWKKGLVRKIQRGQYALCDASDKKHLIHKSISKFITEDQEAITRMVSTSLRHGADVNFVVHQLEKTQGDLQSFAKAVARILKKYIKNGSSIHGEECPQCGGNLFRQEGCVMCSCGWTKCG